MTDENEDNDSPFGGSSTVFVAPSASQSKKGDLRDVPVENAAEIPLFLDADKRGTKSAAYMRIHKRDEPNSGYKGQVPLNTTIDSLARLFGNGYFDIELCNHKHQVLRIKENVKIDVPMGSSTSLAVSDSQKSGEEQILKDLIASHEKEVERLTKTLLNGAEQSERRSKEYTELVRATAREASERERLFMTGQQKMQQEFFSSMMMQGQQMFQQTMVLLSAGHRMTIEALQATLGGKSSDVDTLLKGMAIMREVGGDDDEPWIKALGSGERMLGKLLDLKETKETTSNPSKTKSDKKPPISKAELLEIIRLKNVLHERGIDFTELVRDAREQVEKSQPDDNNSENSEGDSPESSTEAS